MPKLSPLIVSVLLAPSAHAGDNPLYLLVDEYTQQCHELQEEEIIPGIDEDLEPPTVFDPVVTLAPENVYQIEITPEGQKATVLIADFHCPGFGSLGCGVSGSCSAYVIVEDQVFEWWGGGRPVSARAGETVVVISSTGGYQCSDSDGIEGFGAAPCYVAAAWDDDRKKFWSQDGLVKIRGDLSAP
jgi:hypothetical protein